MIFGAAKSFARLACIALIASAVTHAQCSVNSVVVKGRVEHAPRNPSVRVQLIYANQQKGESAEATLDGETFNIPVEFLTQSRRAVLLGSIRTKCDRKPKTLLITLTAGDHEYASVSLDFPKDFKTEDSTVYTLRSELILDAQQP